MNWAYTHNDSTAESKHVNIITPEYKNLTGGHTRTTFIDDAQMNNHNRPYLCR